MARAHRAETGRGPVPPAVLLLILLIACAPSCSRRQAGPDLKLKDDIYGFYPGETKEEVFKRAHSIVTITSAPKPPSGYHGELFYLSAPLERREGIDHVRLGFFNDRLWEIIVYFRDTSADKLEWLRSDLESQYHSHAVAPDGTIETAWKTYRLSGPPGVSITLRRITKKEGTELYVQYFHDVLARQVADRNRALEHR